MVDEIPQPLLIAIAADRGNYQHRALAAKVLAASLGRSLFSGAIRIFRNSPHPLFKIDRQGLVEEYFPEVVTKEIAKTSEEIEKRKIFEFSQRVDFHPRQWVIYSSQAAIALRNLDHLFPSDESASRRIRESDILLARSDHPDGQYSQGFWAVRAEILNAVSAQWNRTIMPTGGKISEREIWNEVVERLPFRKACFEPGEVIAPRAAQLSWHEIGRAAMVTVPDWPPSLSRSLQQALYFGTYLGDETGLFINTLEP